MNANQSTSCLDEAVEMITCPAGFVAGGIACGIKNSGADDLAAIACPAGATTAAVFTRNLVKAAPVVLSQKNVARSGGKTHALIINSGCANAATGEEGARRAAQVMNAVAAHLGCPAECVLMNSTGVIGVQLPQDLIIAALPTLLASCSEDGLSRAASAILTTDTRTKMAQHIVRDGQRMCRVVGIAKGAGMIHPNMATMIAVIMTDAKVDAPALDRLLRGAVDRSFHRISVDGDTSTNDAAFLLASGTAGEFAPALLGPAINRVAMTLAEMVVRDGEGASHLIRVRVTGAATSAEALQMAQTIAASMLVRTSVAGGDPNWGRILAAAGRSGVDFDPERISVCVNGLALFQCGQPATTARLLLEGAYAADEVVFELDLARGEASDEFLTCDLTEEYVRINADYTS